jgi:hypothetical protein
MIKYHDPSKAEIFKLSRMLSSGLIAGVAIFVCSYLALIIGIRLFPWFFVDYFNPVFLSGGERDVLFYLHPLILGMALSVFWQKFRHIFSGHFLPVGITFGFLYALIALVPILWITFSAIDVSFSMVLSWLLYGFFQASVGGIAMALADRRRVDSSGKVDSKN